MKNDNFYKTLRIVCLILAIVCMALSLFKKAKAAIPTDDYDNIISFINENNGNSTNLINNWNNINTIANYYVILPNTNGGSLIGYRIYFFQDDYIIPKGNSISGSNINFYSWYFCYPANNTGGIQYYYDFIINSNNCLLRRCSWRNPEGRSFTYNNISYVENNGYENEITNTLASNEVYRLNINTISNYPCYSNLVNFGFCANNTNPYSTVDLSPYLTTFNFQENNTEGFEVYKYGISGSERLVCDFTNCISISNAVGNTSSIQINITIDGVEKTFNFDSTSSYYNYHVMPSRAIYSFPLTIFGINNETISAKLNGVEIVNTTSSPGGSYVKDIVWLTPLTLVGSDYEDLVSEVIPKEQMPNFDYYDDSSTQTSYNDTMNRWLTSSYSSFDYSLFTRWNFEPKYLVIGVEPYNSSQALKDSLADFIRAIDNYGFGNALAEAITVGQGKTLQQQITEYLNDHLYITDLYDIIVFGYLPSENGSMEYYIYTTDSYNNHLNNSLMYDLIQQVADDGKAIEKTYDYLYDRLNDFEDKTLTKLNEMVGLQEIENGFFSSLQSILNQILNALLNLNIDFPEADYTDIIDKLDTIIENQDTSDINDDWYQNYREWLYGINENDSYLSPHEYFNNIFGTLKTTFDSFTNNISFNAYLLKVEDFINHISGSTTDNLTIYLKDGIGDPGFNINNNYMYTVGGS